MDSFTRRLNNVGHWPSSTLPHRLTPDNGGYHECSPETNNNDYCYFINFL